MKLLTIAGFVAGMTVTILALRKCKWFVRAAQDNLSDSKYDVDELMAQNGM